MQGSSTPGAASKIKGECHQVSLNVSMPAGYFKSISTILSFLSSPIRAQLSHLECTQHFSHCCKVHTLPVLKHSAQIYCLSKIPNQLQLMSFIQLVSTSKWKTAIFTRSLTYPCSFSYVLTIFTRTKMGTLLDSDLISQVSSFTNSLGSKIMDPLQAAMSVF